MSQVKDLLPDFGDGFVAACLQQLGGSPERVLNALLEDALPALLAGMDRQLSLEAWQAAADSTGTQDKGKRPVGGMAGAAGGSYDADFPATLPSVGGGAGAARAAGAAQPRAEDRTARYLDVREETYREALVSAANAAQVRWGDSPAKEPAADACIISSASPATGTCAQTRAERCRQPLVPASLTLSGLRACLQDLKLCCRLYPTSAASRASAALPFPHFCLSSGNTTTSTTTPLMTSSPLAPTG